jgi:putative transcriptional regulator
MSASFHPGEELLLAYAAGSLDEPTALLIATHATLCLHCRQLIEDGEAMGGMVLDDLPADDIDRHALAKVMARLAEQAPPAPPVKPANAFKPDFDGLPAPIHGYVSHKGEKIAWRWLTPGVRQTLLLDKGGTRVRMLKIAPGKPMPHHRHNGIEYTLILSGAYSDEYGHYGVGDFSIADEGTTHQPVAAAEGCICLIMSGAPMQLTGPLGWLVNPILPF